MNGEPGLACVKNLQHNSHFVSSVGTFYDEETFLDLIFICNSDHIKTHKMVLASVSEFIKDIVINTGQDVAYISLPDVNVKTLRVLLNFLYSGETKVNDVELSDIRELLTILGIDLPNAMVINQRLSSVAYSSKSGPVVAVKKEEIETQKPPPVPCTVRSIPVISMQTDETRTITLTRGQNILMKPLIDDVTPATANDFMSSLGVDGTSIVVTGKTHHSAHVVTHSEYTATAEDKPIITTIPTQASTPNLQATITRGRVTPQKNPTFSQMAVTSSSQNRSVSTVQARPSSVNILQPTTSSPQLNPLHSAQPNPLHSPQPNPLHSPQPNPLHSPQFKNTSMSQAKQSVVPHAKSVVVTQAKTTSQIRTTPTQARTSFPQTRPQASQGRIPLAPVRPTAAFPQPRSAQPQLRPAIPTQANLPAAPQGKIPLRQVRAQRGLQQRVQQQVQLKTSPTLQTKVTQPRALLPQQPRMPHQHKMSQPHTTSTMSACQTPALFTQNAGSSTPVSVPHVESSMIISKNESIQKSEPSSVIVSRDNSNIVNVSGSPANYAVASMSDSSTDAVYGSEPDTTTAARSELGISNIVRSEASSSGISRNEFTANTASPDDVYTHGSESNDSYTQANDTNETYSQTSDSNGSYAHPSELSKVYAQTSRSTGTYMYSSGRSNAVYAQSSQSNAMYYQYGEPDFDNNSDSVYYGEEDELDEEEEEEEVEEEEEDEDDDEMLAGIAFPQVVKANNQITITSRTMKRKMSPVPSSSVMPAKRQAPNVDLMLEKEKKKSTPLPAEARKRLLEEFENKAYLTRDQAIALAEETDLDVLKIQRFFSRQRQLRKKNALIEDANC